MVRMDENVVLGRRVMRVLICGDRNWKNREAIFACVGAFPEGVPVIEGEQRGADKIAAEAGRFHDVTVLGFPAEWDRYGKAAGRIRNRQMLKEGKPTLVVFFHNNLRESKGTKDMVKIAVAAGVPVLNGRSVSDWGKALELYAKLGDEAILVEEGVIKASAGSI